jgi:short-subunit dehydrogenase
MLAVITGASRGIGESFARHLAARGAHLHLVARDAGRLSKLARELRTAHGVDVEEIVLDLARFDAAEHLYVEVRSRRRVPVDMFVNNAGFGLYGEFAEHPMTRIEEMLLLHTVTVTKLMRLFLAEMRDGGSGVIINVASVAGLLPLPYMALYAATKAFLVSLGLGVDQEARRHGVLVHTCCPGNTVTDFQSTARIPGRYAYGGKQTADEVVIETLKAVDRRRPIIVCGVRNRFLMHAQRLIPRALLLRATARTLKPV